MGTLEEELKRFDFIQFTMPDIHGIPKGRLVPAELVAQACRDGVGIFSGTQYLGVQGEIPTQIKDFADGFPSGYMRPLAGTVRPLTWSSAPGRRMGHVMCQLQVRGKVMESCPRVMALKQVQRLTDKGWIFRSAFECEFDLLKDMKPFGGDAIPYANFDLLDPQLELFTELISTLRESGVRTEYFFPEYQAGQYEFSMQPQYGVESADDAFMLRYGVRAFMARKGLQATFMAVPFDGYHSAGFHFNHSIISQEGDNLFQDASDPDKLSQLARHWIAGLVEHAPALCALGCPTVNCYRRLHGGFAPGVIYWNFDDRISCVRAKGSDHNALVENRMPSSACNPYVVLAATIAAGLDGVEKSLACPKPGPPPSSDVRRLPATLSEALGVLEKDDVIRKTLGRLVDDYVAVKRDNEVNHFQKIVPPGATTAEQIDLERQYYLQLI